MQQVYSVYPQRTAGMIPIIPQHDPGKVTNKTAEITDNLQYSACVSISLALVNIPNSDVQSLSTVLQHIYKDDATTHLPMWL